MTEPTEQEFINSFAKEWNEKLAEYLTRPEDGRMTYVGWLNLAQMLSEFLKEHKERKRK